MIKGIIDRFENEYAIIEIEGTPKVVERSDIPSEAREGDVMVFSRNTWTIDKTGTIRRSQKINNLANELWNE